ncbi:MAG: hypothetical protein Q9213_002320 [Squamulea squamosa]
MMGPRASLEAAAPAQKELVHDAGTVGTHHEPERDEDVCTMMLRKLPQELVDMVEEWIYEISFCPGYLYPAGEPLPFSTPDGQPQHESRKRRNQIASPRLLTLSRFVKNKYRTRMYTDNIVVIDRNRCRCFLDIPYGSVAYPMRKFEVIFGKADPAIIRLKLLPDPYMDYQILDADEFSEVSQLTLDFRECYDAEGNWLGLELARNLDPLVKLTNGECSSRLPANFKVLGPDTEKEVQLVQIIRDLFQKYQV